jgi:hypothetical protein
MNTLIINDQKSFTNDSRTNYINYNKSNIFNTDIKPQINPLVNVMKENKLKRNLINFIIYNRISKINSKKRDLTQSLK